MYLYHILIYFCLAIVRPEYTYVQYVRICNRFTVSSPKFNLPYSSWCYPLPVRLATVQYIPTWAAQRTEEPCTLSVEAAEPLVNTAMSGSLASPPKKHPSVLRRFDEARMLPDHTNLPKPNQKTAALLRPKAGVATVKHSAASTLVGFNASFLQFANEAGVSLAMTAKDVHDSSRPTLSTVNMLDQLSIDTLSSRRTETKSLVELRNYTSQMDNFTSQTFVIYGGQAVKESPEFVDFKRDYASDFGCIAGLVTRLEEILRNHGVKHAVISCKEIHKIAQLSLNYIPEADLLKCIVNLEQIQPQLNKKRMYGHNMRARAAVKIQSYIRKRRAVINYKRLTIEAKAAVYLQSNFRTVIQRVRMVSHYHGLRALEDKRCVSTARDVSHVR